MRWLILLAVSLPLLAQPIAVFEKRCGGCHNAGTKAGGLVLNARPPNPARLLERVQKGEMPPGGKLPDAEISLIAAWVNSGAAWDAGKQVERKRGGKDWWSLQPLKPIAGDIDSLVARALLDKGLARNAAADRRTLIRRVTFDLTGLPPTPAETSAFLADATHDAYEKVVERLLASPRYGERWGRHWLDVVRFGESHGYEQNHLRERAWPYRDYVIDSFNTGKSFRQMVLEQLAGDRLAPGVMSIEAATGFLVAGTHDTVGIQNVEGARIQRANDLDDMVVATSAGFLGLTVGCARCHDHKFDPIQQADYYKLAAVFAGVQHAERDVTSDAERAARVAIAAPLETELEGVKKQIAQLRDSAEPEIGGRRDEFTRGYRPAVDSKLTVETLAPVQARYVRLEILAADRKSSPSLDEFEVLSGGANLALHARVTARKTRSSMDDKAFYQPELLTDGKFDANWISGDSGTGQVTVDLGEPRRIDKVQWSRDRLGAFQGRFLSQVPTQYRVEVSLDGQQWRQVADSKDRLPYGEQAMQDFLLTQARPEAAALLARKVELEALVAKLPKPPAVYAGRFEQPKEPLKLNKRGNPMDLGDAMPAASPSVLEQMLPGFQLDPEAPEAERRLALARWITDDRNALSARVLANRVWHYHFGRGLAGTPSDFGFNGERPTHPELLDYLAGRLIAHGWKLKPLHREIVLSATYRQSSAANEKALGVDSEARLLWRFPPRRLDAEALRDAVLAVTGKLNESMGGPGFRLYRYTVDNVATYYPLENPGPETYRRAVYHQWARSVKDDLMSTYDCPDSALPEPRRVQTTTPLQALSMMNSAFMLDQARYFAARVRGAASPVEEAYLLALGRPPSAVESAEAQTFLSSNSLELFCRVLLNASEFSYVF